MIDKSKSKTSGGDSTKKTRDPLLVSTRLKNTSDVFDHVSSEVRLWRSVILQAIVDASIDIKSKDVKIKEEVALWLDSEDFYTICSCAGITAEKLSPRIMDILKESSVARAKYKALDLKDEILLESTTVF